MLLALAWGVIVVGRGVCLLAQRVPPLVWLVRAVYRWKAGRGSERDVPVAG